MDYNNYVYLCAMKYNTTKEYKTIEKDSYVLAYKDNELIGINIDYCKSLTNHIHKFEDTLILSNLLFRQDNLLFVPIDIAQNLENYVPMVTKEHVRLIHILKYAIKKIKQNEDNINLRGSLQQNKKQPKSVRRGNRTDGSGETENLF